jgi:hypothetical protein
VLVELAASTQLAHRRACEFSEGFRHATTRSAK